MALSSLCRRAGERLGAGDCSVQLLIAALDRAIALFGMQDVGAVRDDLNLDMAADRYKAFQINPVIAAGAAASAMAIDSWADRSSGRSTRFIPLPPPPATALIRMG